MARTIFITSVEWDHILQSNKTLESSMIAFAASWKDGSCHFVPPGAILPLAPGETKWQKLFF